MRGIRPVLGVELVKNRATKEPLNTPQDKAPGSRSSSTRCGEMMKRGVTVLAWVSHLVIAPPLIVTEAQIDEGIAALDAALSIADARVAA